MSIAIVMTDLLSTIIMGVPIKQNQTKQKQNKRAKKKQKNKNNST